MSHDKNLLKPDKIDFKELARHNVVVIIFIIITIGGAFLSDLPTHFMVRELVARISRNSFLVLSLIIPILAGVGLNFGIVVGAMAGQIALIMITYWGVDGTFGLLLAVGISTPIAMLFGWLTGQLFNRTKGQEMIAGLIVGFFAMGLYQFLLLFVVGGIIPIKDTPMLKPDGIGLRNTISMGAKHGDGIKYGFDKIFELNLWILLIIVAAGLLIFKIISSRKKGHKVNILALTPFILIIIGSAAIQVFGNMLWTSIKAPVVTWLLITALCIFNVIIMKTKLGQDFKAIGQSQHISGVAGINVDKTRIIAVTIFTVLAAWGQIIFLQNVGTMNTYGSHMQVGMFSIAAILIGGASVINANIRHAIIGVILFHSVFIVSPTAGKTLFGDAQIGEFFRAFVVYGVIGVSLGLHAWKTATAKKKKD